MVKYLLAALIVLLAWIPSSPAAAQGAIPCNQWAIIHDVGATSLTQFIAPSANQRIGLCGYAMIASAMPAALQLAYGTGTNCGTGTTNISPAIVLPVSGILVNRTDNVVERTPANNALCFVSVGQTGTMDAIVYWAYF
jgi:hypothetical protein